MPISMRCPGCQTRFEFADDLDGKRIKCKSCGDIFRVADGMLIEHWTSMDLGALRSQLQAK